MKIPYTILMILFILSSSLAQESINYKAKVKDTDGNLVSNQEIDVRFSIVDDLTSEVVYLEEHLNIITNPEGIIILNIGEGNTADALVDIDWGHNTYSLKTEIGLEDDGMFEDLGTTPFKAVPCALHALTSSDNKWSTNTNTVYNSENRVGIGSDTLTAKTSIFYDCSHQDPHLLLHENDNDYARLNFRNLNGDGAMWSMQAYLVDYSPNDRLNFWNDRGGVIMSLTGDGEVGIGTSISPKTGFHVGEDKRVLFGKDTLGPGDKLMWLPDLHAFRVGTIDEGASANYWDKDSIGQYSFASGRNTRAKGYGAT